MGHCRGPGPPPGLDTDEVDVCDDALHVWDALAETCLLLRSRTRWRVSDDVHMAVDAVGSE